MMASQMGVQFDIVEDSNNEFNFPSPPASSSFAAADSNVDVIITNEIIPDSLTQSFEEDSEAEQKMENKLLDVEEPNVAEENDPDEGIIMHLSGNSSFKEDLLSWYFQSS